jgi:putative PIN family toxin of toxin-antitoxin system
MSETRPGVVFDCNVLLQATLRETGPAAECLRLLDDNLITVFLSRATLREVRGVMCYSAIRTKNPALTDARVAAFLDRLTFKALLVRRVRHVFDYPRAEQDEPYIDLAVTAKANYLVTRDDDLLSLMSGHSALCKRFRRLTRPLKVLDPTAFLREMSRPQRREEPDG